MEKRSLVLSALILAIAASAVLFYNFGDIGSDQLTAGLPVEEMAEGEEMMAAEAEAAVAGAVEGETALAQAGAIPPAADPAAGATTEAAAAVAAPEDPAAVGTPVHPAAVGAAGTQTVTTQDVAPTAETGAAEVAIVAALLAMVAGAGGLVLVARQAG